MKLKLGLDIGVASVGWGIIDKEYNIIDCGVRLFIENSADENVTRRTMRSSRRRLRRLQHRLHRMNKVLSNALSIDKPLEAGNIYEVRCRGLKEKLTKEELFAAIMHLAKRRGTHFMTAEDYEKIDGEEKSTEEILKEQEEKLKDKYVCQIQYEKFISEGKVRGIDNRFRNKEYRKELEALLTKQEEYYPKIKEAIAKILEIYDSKREFFQGPGGPNSPTPYGSYRYDNDGNIIKVNLIDLMRGTCTFFKSEKRIAHNSYTACLFNLLNNDLNNIKIQGRPISYEEKRELIENYINQGKNVTLQNIAKVTGVKSDDLRGYRIDKSEKPIFTEFKGYKDILKAFDKDGIDDAFIRGNRDLVDTIAEILTKEKDVEERYKELVNKGIATDAASVLKTLAGFTKYHSLSQKTIELILDDLWHTNENQMQLFTKIGLFKQERAELRRINIPFDGSGWIVSPVTKRAVNEAIKIINEARSFVRKKYNCEFAAIVIEMAREKNSKEQVTFINKMQKENELKRKEIGKLVDLKRLNGKQFELLKLLLQQDFKCAYSLKPVNINHVISGALEVDHIIPISISFDDSLANKVAVLVEENRQKGQNTPFQYLKSSRGKVSYDEFKNWVLNNKSFNKKKRENLLYEDNPQEELTRFINRNLVDTRYASREVLNLLKAYFAKNKPETKVSVIKGSFTHAFRKKARLDKDREATYAHHAQDALIVAGLSNTQLIRKLDKLLHQEQDLLSKKDDLIIEDGKIINTATGQLIAEDDFNSEKYIRFIKGVEYAKPKYSHKVDRKPNRALYDQQIKSTRVKVKDNKTYRITKYKNIYDDKSRDSSGEKLKKKILEKPEELLMYHNDPKTFAKLKEVVDAYPDSKNPFADFYNEKKEKVKKYSKKGNGPVVSDVKLYDGALGSHRKNLKQQGSNMSVYLSIKTMRADFYLDKGTYKFVSVPYDMIINKDKEFYIEMEKYDNAKKNKGFSADAKFLFTLHSGEILSYEKDGELLERCYKCINDDARNVIEMGLVDRPADKRYRETIGRKIKNLVKYNVDVLGNKYPVKEERFSTKINV